jgi:CRP-like cAMP-binding protein
MVTDRQVSVLRSRLMEGKTRQAAAAAAGMSVHSARQWHTGPYPSQARKPHLWRTRPDPFGDVLESEIAPLLAADETRAMEARTILAELDRHHPGCFSARQLRTLQRRIREWRAFHGPEKHVYFPQVHPPGREAALGHLDYRVLARKGVLASLSSQQLKALAAACTVERIRAGAMLPDHNGPVIVLHGAVRVIEVRSNGKRRVTRIAGRGSIFGGFPWPTRPHQAIVDSTIAKLTHGQFARALCGVSFETLRPAFEVLVKPAFDTLIRYARALDYPLALRLAGEILYLVEHFGVQDDRGTLIALRVTNVDLAGILGCSVREVIGLMANLRRERLVWRDARSLIVDRKRLQHKHDTGVRKQHASL